jgi:hypothetical protein
MAKAPRAEDLHKTSPANEREYKERQLAPEVHRMEKPGGCFHLYNPRCGCRQCTKLNQRKKRVFDMGKGK